MEDRSGNELDEPQKFAVKKKLFISTRDGVDEVINYVGSSTH
jgi:hypothetical protein